uniref:Uncharacterized protein n=1 Tax=viral metagenome TaxID=1070528 RepID=A0A6C0M0W8_9ZZZZ
MELFVNGTMKDVLFRASVAEKSSRTLTYDEFAYALLTALLSREHTTTNMEDLNFIIEKNRSILNTSRYNIHAFVQAFGMINDGIAFPRTVISIDLKALHSLRGYIHHTTYTFDEFVSVMCDKRHYVPPNEIYTPSNFYLLISTKKDMFELYIEGSSVSELSIAFPKGVPTDVPYAPHESCVYEELRDHHIVLPLVAMKGSMPYLWLHVVKRDDRPIVFRVREYDLHSSMLDRVYSTRIDNIEFKDVMCYVENGVIQRL